MVMFAPLTVEFGAAVLSVAGLPEPPIVGWVAVAVKLALVVLVMRYPKEVTKPVTLPAVVVPAASVTV